MSQALHSVLMEGRLPCAGGEDVVAGFTGIARRVLLPAGPPWDCLNDRRAAVVVIPVMVSGNSMPHSDVPCIHPRDALVLQTYLQPAS